MHALPVSEARSGMEAESEAELEHSTAELLSVSVPDDIAIIVKCGCQDVGQHSNQRGMCQKLLLRFLSRGGTLLSMALLSTQQEISSSIPICNRSVTELNLVVSK